MNERKLSKWAAIAEIVSSIAVLLTLGYLAVQTNQMAKQTEQNTAALLSSARQESLNAELSAIYKFMDNASLYIERVPLDKLPPEEGYKMYSLITTLIRIRENLWWQYNNKVLDEATWLSYRKLLVKVIRDDQRFRTVWEAETAQGVYDANFVNEINAFLEKENKN